MAESQVHTHHMVFHFPSYLWLSHINNHQDMTTSEPAKELATVKSRKQDIVIPRGQLVIVSCRAAVGPVSKIPVLFELDPNHSWPRGLEITETQVTVAGGSTCGVNIRVDNPTNHDITL